jgi:hypothetical protein
MSSAPHLRKTFKISDSLNRQLNTYALAASAAGVSMLALARASEAKVVYTETHQVTHRGFPLYIDLNHDGIKDFLLRTTYYAGTAYFKVGLDASGYRNINNAVAGRRFSHSGYFFLLPPLGLQAPKSDQNAISSLISHLWRWSFSTVSAPASIPT